MDSCHRCCWIAIPCCCISWVWVVSKVKRSLICFAISCIVVWGTLILALCWSCVGVVRAETLVAAADASERGIFHLPGWFYSIGIFHKMLEYESQVSCVHLILKSNSKFQNHTAISKPDLWFCIHPLISNLLRAISKSTIRTSSHQLIFSSLLWFEVTVT